MLNLKKSLVAGAVIVTVGVAGLAYSRRTAVRPLAAHQNSHAAALAAAEHAREADDRVGIEQARYDDKAYPNETIDYTMRQSAALAFEAVARRPGGKRGNWQAVGPKTPNVPALVTYTNVANVVSGRISALALSPSCAEEGDDCRVFVGAAGGGIWTAEGALGAGPLEWRQTSAGIPTNAIGSIAFDPTDSEGRTLYVGTGEANQSADSEAGLGLFRSTNGGRSWSLVEGSVAVAADNSIAAVKIDPSNARHILIGTNSGIRGGSATAGGATLPPGAPPLGLYESFDGGKTFSSALALPVSEIALDPADPSTVYAATFQQGIWRRSARLDGDSAFHLILAPIFGFERDSISVTTKAGHTRVYASRGSGVSAQSDLLRADNADVPAAALLAAGFLELSSAVPGTPGYASSSYCGSQCWYDIYISSPAGRPDELWIGGSMQYGEIFTANPPSNGRAVQRSIDAGASFTDMTNDAQNLGMHPDQHAIAFAGAIAFVASDGGLMRTSGAYVDASSQCDTRGLAGADLVDCKAWLSAIPTRLTSLNDGLATLQFQSLSINHHDPLRDIIGGTQDNGTWAFTGTNAFESVGGDGGNSGVDVGNGNIRMHTYTAYQGDVNFNGTDPLGWNYFGDGLAASGEAFGFYMPLINDPAVSGTWFAGGQHVFRTQDNGGPQDYLVAHCNEYTGDFTVPCGDWEKLGGPTLTGFAYGTDKRTSRGNYLVAIARAPADKDTIWAATRRGRVFIATNASATPASSVAFKRIDTASQPNRFVSAIAVDAADPNHAFVAFSGYAAATPTQPGHVFEVHYVAATSTAVWTDLTANLGDQPITALARDDLTGNLYAGTEFGVAVLKRGGTHWAPAAGNMPAVAVYSLPIDSGARVMYAATHGRGAFKLDLSLPDNDDAQNN